MMNSTITSLVSSASQFSTNNHLAIIQEAASYYKVRQQEQTKRAYIASRRDVLVQALESEKELILTYFEHRFAERKVALENLFDMLQQATTNKDSDALQIALTGILGVIKDNPLSDLAEFRKSMANPDFTIEL